MYLNAVEQAVASKQLNGSKITSGAYTIMENGNLCLVSYKNAETCVKENILEIEVDGETPIKGSISIDSGEIIFENLNEPPLADGSISMSLSMTKNVEEGTVSIVINVDSFTEGIGLLSIIGSLNFNSDKLKYLTYNLGDGVVSDYYVTLVDDTLMTSSINYRERNETGVFAEFVFEPDNIDNVTASDFVYYVRIDNLNGESIPIIQTEGTEIYVVNQNIAYKEYVGISSNSYTPGDVNNDGFINGSDILLLRKAAASSIPSCKAMDVNGDGVVNTTDFVRLKKYLSGVRNVTLEYSTMTDVPDHS